MSQQRQADGRFRILRALIVHCVVSIATPLMPLTQLLLHIDASSIDVVYVDRSSRLYASLADRDCLTSRRVALVHIDVDSNVTSGRRFMRAP